MVVNYLKKEDEKINVKTDTYVLETNKTNKKVEKSSHLDESNIQIFLDPFIFTDTPYN